jgi:hypothetical protein
MRKLLALFCIVVATAFGQNGNFATVKVANGSAAAPSYKFTGTTATTGFYWAGPGSVGVTSAGAASLYFNSGGIVAGTSSNSVALPSTGAITLAAGGTNQNITLTPSGTGKVTTNLGDVAAIGVNGFPARTASGAFAARTLTGTAGQIAVTNGDGVSGNPTLSLPATITQAQTFSGITTISNATASTSATTGGLTVAGGVGVQGSVYVGGSVVAKGIDLTQTYQSRQIFNYMLSDGATANRRGEMTPGAAGNVAGQTITICGWIQWPTSNPSADAFVAAFCGVGTTAPLGQNNAFSIRVDASGPFVIDQRGAVAASDFRRMLFANARSTYSGQLTPFSITLFGNSTTNPVVFINGVDVSASFTPTTGGTAPNWMPTTLDCTKFIIGHNWPAGVAPIAEYGLGQWSAAESLAFAQTGRKPDWWANGTGSAVKQTSGTLTIGRRYIIADAGGTFTGVGAADNNVDTVFTATGATPTWSTGSVRPLGPVARHALQPGCAVAPDSGSNGLPLFLASGMSVVGDLPSQVIVQCDPMTADGFIFANQTLTDSRYELIAAYARQTGIATSTITVRETSSGGTTVATGALSSSSTRVALTVSNGLLAGGKALHLSNSSWGGNTVAPFLVFRRCQMP